MKTIRTVLLNSADVRTYVSEAEYDSWNRIRKMVYPDGETVTYGYDRAGQLNRMTSEKDGFTYDFITDMIYDVYGNIATKTYGNGTTTRYTYDHTGTRAIRSHGPLEGVYINGAEQGLDYHDADNYTLYVSPYLIVNNERFTKHYYAGTQRIASKVGSGDFYNVYGVNGFHLTAGQKDYEERLVQMEEGVKQYYRQNGIPPGVPTQKGSNADPYQTSVALPNVPLGNYDVPQGWPTNVRFNPPGDVPGPPVQFESEDMGDPGAGFGFESDRTYEGDWFFFHSDHLGSTSYLTDTAGNVSQFVCYTPYGEAIVDEHLTTYENPFKFSGKELDDITGLYDHGARSRNPISTLCKLQT